MLLCANCVDACTRGGGGRVGSARLNGKCMPLTLSSVPAGCLC